MHRNKEIISSGRKFFNYLLSNVYKPIHKHLNKQTMKTASRILMTFALLVFFSGITFSQVASTVNPEKTKTKSATVASGKTTDASCKHESQGACAQGKNFTDKNGDGICDNCGSSGKCKGTSCGQGMKNGNGCQQGQGKGNCDGKGMKNGAGCGKGQQNGNCCAKKSSCTQGTQPSK